jgi:PAS domain S-box-containing protein
MPSRPTILTVRLIAGLVTVAGLAAGLVRFTQVRQGGLAQLFETTRQGALAFQPAELQTFTGTAQDLKGAAYSALRARLGHVREVDPNVKSAWLFRYLPARDQAILLVDREPADARHPARPGDPVAEGRESPRLQAGLRRGEAAVDDRVRGTDATLTGYAPIGPKVPAGSAQDFFGVSLATDHWLLDPLIAAAGAALLVWLVAGLPLGAYLMVRRQAGLRAAVRNLAAASDQDRAAVMVFDLAGKIEHANAGFCALVAGERSDLIGRNWRELQLMDPDAPPQQLAELTASIRAGQPWTGEWLKRRADGATIPLRGRFTPVKRGGGEPVAFVATLDDLTESQRTEATLRDAQMRAEAGDEAKSQFLATMSHEVRTPLNGILGFTNLLLETPLTPDQREYVETIQLSGETLIQLTDGILDYARMESGKFQLEPMPCGPRECVEDALDLVATKAAAKGLELLHWVDDSVPAAVMADSNRLRQVLTNLLNNAVEFTPRGEVEVRVGTESGLEPDAAGAVKLVFSVRDTGMGISPEQHAELFRPFNQLDHTLTRRHGGAGLGLAICKNIVGLMGGQMELKSEPGRGSTFSFTIPVAAVCLTPGRGPAPPLDQLTLAIAVPAGSLRAELLRLGRRFGAKLMVNSPEELNITQGWDAALMDVSPALAAELAALPQPRSHLPPERIFGLVPLALPSPQRAALRAHFRLLINKPVHQDALRGLLATLVEATPAAPPRGPVTLNVLLVDDDPVNQLLMQKELGSLGCRWSTADSSENALRELARGPYDFVLMDLHMPGVDGLTAIQLIRAGEAGAAMKDVWIAALTADARIQLRERALAVGANDYLVKPVTVPELRVALERCVMARRPRPSRVA